MRVPSLSLCLINGLLKSTTIGSCNLPQLFSLSMHARFEMYSILQRRRRALQESSLSREAHLDLAPAHMDAEGEQYYQHS